ncbi:hypothetical protein BC832DRAFT_315224 [Gaertneriomyces semiglobifer]|nr:hypothetical protein BC832DRAFT_315224 [Gaertneriomyces semiglobifer]
MVSQTWLQQAHGFVHLSNVFFVESRGDPATPTPASSLGTLFKPEPEADAGMSVSLLSARIRMLEQALRQSETRYDDLRKQHESTVMKSQAEQRELINGKLRMERRCHELEALGRQLEQANAELEQRCSRLQHLLQQIPADGSLKDVANAEDCGHASLRNSPGGIDSDTVRNLWK